jgi:signal recognition particle receptor subunit beta
MVQINFAQKQVNAKVVYYGPGMSGKTTNLEIVHQKAPNENRGDLTSISTDGDRTLFFDYMPLDLGTVAGMRTCFQLYTVPGQVYYNSTRKLVLQGVDGVIFVADSSPGATEANLESLRNLEENLNEYGKSLATLPFVLQYNKRDMPGALSVAELDAQMNPHRVPTFEAVAATGQGVFPTLKGLASIVLKNLMAETTQGAQAPAAALPTARPAAAPAPAPAAAPVAASAAYANAAASGGPAAARATGAAGAVGGLSMNTSAAASGAGYGSAPAAGPARPGGPLSQTGFHTRPGQRSGAGGYSGAAGAPARQAPVPNPTRNKPVAAAVAAAAPAKSAGFKTAAIVAAALAVGVGATLAVLKFL